LACYTCSDTDTSRALDEDFNSNNNNKYVKRKEGGRGLVQIEAAYKAEIINIAEYLNTTYKEDQFVNIVKSHESTQPNMNSIIKTAAKITEELSQE